MEWIISGKMATKFYDYNELGKMSIAGLMSGRGTNLVKIIRHEKELDKTAGAGSPYHVAVIFSDTPKSNANEIGSIFGIPVLTYDLESFCAKRGLPVRNMAARYEYEEQCMKALEGFNCPVAAFAGYMRKASGVFLNSFLAINVHPADLTIKGPDGKPKYRGDHAVLDALKAGEKEIRATTHIAEKEVDCGRILMISKPVIVTHKPSEITPEIADEYQEKLKEVGDWDIFPRTLQHIAEGRFARDGKDELYFDGRFIPNGVRLE